jgi:hypothetical protein
MRAKSARICPSSNNFSLERHTVNDPITEIGKLSDFLIAHFPSASEPAPRLHFTPAAQHLFAGILMASDRMASGFAFTPGKVVELAADVLRRTEWSAVVSIL